MKPRLSQRLQFSLVYLLVGVLVLSLLQSWLLAPRTVELSMSKFLELLRQGQIERVALTELEIRGVARPGALPVPEAVKSAAARLQEELRKAGADVGWTRPEQMHLTLKFFAEIGAAEAARFAELLTASLPRKPIDLEYAGLGRFPKVIWAGVKGDLAPLAALAEDAAERVGVSRETRPFSPHLTLGRIRSPRNARTSGRGPSG